MALDFPANPTNGQVYDSYVYNSTVGAWQSREDSRTVAILSSTVPASANPGDIWVNTNDGISFVYYDDGTSAQWIEMLPSGVPLLNTKANISGGNSFTGQQSIDGVLKVINGSDINLNAATNVTPDAGDIVWRDLSGTELHRLWAPSGQTTLSYRSASGTTYILWHSGNDGTGSGLDADLLDGNHASAFALLSGANFSGLVQGVYGGTGTRFYASNTTAGTDQYTNAFNVGNDTGNKVIHFLNSSTRTVDGGANAYTIRNDGGMLNLGNSSYGTNVYGTVTLANQPIISGQVGSSGSLIGSQIIQFDDFWVQRGITYNSTTRRFTVPSAGIYRITMNPFFITGQGGTRILIGVNTDAPTASNHKGHAYREAATYDTGSLNSVVSLAANDYICFYIYSGGIYNQSGDRFNQFSISKIA